ncbi:MAG TPA: hypothetical protein VHV30_03785 [Polyangiaceae bacterium]|jgi:hypothetical protein|nr:hypothetical protein [Polyangiaceae bacterium]
MPKPLKVAGEVDSYCTKCRLVLNHRIVSMKNGKAHQVECLTCRSTHLWRANAPGEKAPAGAGERAARPSSGPASARAPRVTQAQKHEQTWEKALNGKGPKDFKPYNVGGSFQEGDLLRHKKFGDGLVTRVIDLHKVEVLFRDEARTLAQGMN